MKAIMFSAGLVCLGTGAANIYAFAGMASVGKFQEHRSTALIMFEMAGSWKTSLAVMMSVSLSPSQIGA